MTETASAPDQRPRGVPAIGVHSIEATYVDGRARLPVLAGVSFSVADGEFVAVIGPSGSGKSTLLDAIAGLMEPDRGEIMLNGTSGPARSRLGRSSYMRQRDLLLPWRNVVDNAALALEISGVSKTRARALVRARLNEFGLDGFELSYPAQLSGGMRQRVAFLRTILAGQPLVLLDEPFGGLDALTRAAMQDWSLTRFAVDQRTVLLVTHDIEEAVYLADRVVVLSGRPAKVVHIESIELPRPRYRGLVATSAFVGHKATILRELGLLLERATA